jgi:hypothetical protein
MKAIQSAAVVLFSFAFQAFADTCIECHKTKTPNIVSDWQLSKHSQNGIGCSICHGDGHQSAEDVDKVALPTPATCQQCHPDQVDQFMKGKHSAAWAAMKAMPTAHAQPVAMMEGMKGCGGCHKVGVKSKEDLVALNKAGSGFGRTDLCGAKARSGNRGFQPPERCCTERGRHPLPGLGSAETSRSA